MSKNQNIEIEFKNMLTKEEYELLLTHFQVSEEDLFEQENHYFDTSNFALKANHSALRIRKKEAEYELTLKQPHPDGLLETNKILSKTESDDIFSTGRISDEQISSLLRNMNIDPTSIIYFGSLRTIRAEKKIGNGLLVLDHSFYLKKEDYELEYEVSNREEGKIYFQELLATLKIPVRKTKNKVRRFYDEKYNQK
ncbi:MULTISPECIES: CYTH domain-containing protein [Niallia]|uniref:CYTH domain-containing protein n=1 Tax=Niallia TaxID=2837506 RepID=UPI000F451A93|nr:CYTH domain-containing protein [Niallia circulans]AYV65508.1 CYTH domain-containing protein [Niallia circulans]AYV71686.1 CYTH domain-containing protein [Niallia circulans]NRG28335.1 CYTH domain-containing protein [Niallia circulans]